MLNVYLLFVAFSGYLIIWAVAIVLSPRTPITRTRLFSRLYVFMRKYRTALIGKYFVMLYEKDGARVLQTRFRSFHCQEVALAGFLSSR
jgi:hypothetical protein